MNENQPHTSNTNDNIISNTANETGFNFEKYDPYINVLRILFVPSVDKRICELLELFYTDKKDTPTYWERCLNIVSSIKYEVGVVQNYLKQAFYYFVNNGLVNSMINTLVLSNRLDKVCRDLDSLGEKNLRRYANAWNFVNEKSYWHVSKQSVPITFKGSNRSVVEVEVGSTSSAYPTSNSNSSPQKFKNVRKFSRRSSKKSNSEVSSCSCSSSQVQCAEFALDINNNNDSNEKKLMVLIGDPQNLKYSEIRKLSVPCKCENLIKHFVKTDFIESPLSVKAKNKLEKALRNTCFSLNQILEPMDFSNVHKCRLLCKLQENYVKIQLKKQETNGDKTCLFTERIDISKKDLSFLRDRSFDLENISEEKISGNSKSVRSEGNCCGSNEIRDDNSVLIENDSQILKKNSKSMEYDAEILKKNSPSMENDAEILKNNSQSIENDSKLKQQNLVFKKNSFDLNESDLRNSNLVSSTKIYDNSIPKKKNKCLHPKHCGNLRGDLCKCAGQCFCDLDSFDDDYTTARTSIKSWDRSSIKCDSEHSCNCSFDSSVGSVVENKNCCSGENGCGGSLRGSNIDIYINIKENDVDMVSKQSEGSKTMKSISVQTIEENSEPRPVESDGKLIEEDSGSILAINSSVFEALKTIAEESCDCDEEIVACAEEQLIDFGESNSAENSYDCEENSLPEVPRNESRSKISEGFVKHMVDKIEGNNLDNAGNCSLDKSVKNNEDCNSLKCSSKLVENNEVSVDGKHEIDCNCSVCSGSLKGIEGERKESSFTNENDCNSLKYSASLQEMNLERKESSSEDKKHEIDCNCSVCSGSLQEIKEQRKESSFTTEKHENDCNCSSCSDSVEKINLKMSKSFEESAEQIEGNLQECELGGESTCSIDSFQAEMPEFVERKSEISESIKEVDEFKAVKLLTDKEVEDSEGCGCTIDSEDIFTSAHSVVQKSAVEIEISKVLSSLSPIVESLKLEMENPEVSEAVELKPKVLSLDSVKMKTEEVEEKSSVEKSERRKSSLEKNQLEEPKIVSSESSAPETRRSVKSQNTYKISKASLSPAEANCGSSSYYRSNFCLHNYYFNCDCSETDRFPKRSSVPKKNYQSINADKLQRHESNLQMNFRAIISSLCRNLQKLNHICRVKIYKLLKERDKATSTYDLPLYTHHYHKNNSKKVSKFSLNLEEPSDLQNRCPYHHKKAQILYRKNDETNFGKIPCPSLSSTKQHKEVINQRKQLHCYCNAASKNGPSRKSNSCSLASNYNCNHNYMKKRLSDTSLSTYSQVSQVDYAGKNGSGDSENSRCHCYKKKLIAARHLADYLAQLQKRYNKYRKSYCNDCRGSLEEDIKLLKYMRMNFHN